MNEAEAHVDDRRWWILSVLCLSLVMVILGSTVLAGASKQVSIDGLGVATVVEAAAFEDVA